MTKHADRQDSDWGDLASRLLLAALPKALLLGLILCPLALDDDPWEAALPGACAAVESGTPDQEATTRLADVYELTWSQARHALYAADEDATLCETQDSWAARR